LSGSISEVASGGTWFRRACADRGRTPLHRGGAHGDPGHDRRGRPSQARPDLLRPPRAQPVLADRPEAEDLRSARPRPHPRHRAQVRRDGPCRPLGRGLAPSRLAAMRRPREPDRRRDRTLRRYRCAPCEVSSVRHARPRVAAI